jgi:glycosyltransferase involved in cell wall biosynthesis
MKKLKVLIVTADYPPPMGGMQVFTYELEQELKKAGHAVEVLNFDGRNINTYEHLQVRDLFYTESTKNTTYTLTKILNPLNLLKISGGYRDFVFKNMIYRVTRKKIKDFEPDIVHVMKNDLYSAVFNIPMPYIVSCHSSNVDIYDAEHIKYSLNHAAKIHCVSDFTKELAKTIVSRGDKDFNVIYNFIDLEKYKNKSEKRENIIITISRLTEKKNIDTLIRAFSLLPRDLKSKFKYIIVGGGPNLEKLKNLAKELHLNNIEFTGEITDEHKKIKLLSSSKIFLFCPAPIQGEIETFGIVFIEAQASLLPVVCSKIGGVPESVGKGGLYVEKPTDPKEIAEKMEMIMRDEKLYTNLVEEIKNRIATFDKKIWLGKILEMYTQVLK